MQILNLLNYVGMCDIQAAVMSHRKKKQLVEFGLKRKFAISIPKKLEHCVFVCLRSEATNSSVWTMKHFLILFQQRKKKK